MKNKKINLIGHAVILGIMMVTMLLPINVKADVLTDGNIASQNVATTQTTTSTGVWTTFSQFVAAVQGVLMGD